MSSRRLPPLQTLVALDAFARTGTVHGAAQELEISPSSVSRQLSQLQSWAGTTLFVAEGRTLTMTEQAQSLAARVAHALLLTESACGQLLRDAHGEPGGKSVVNVLISGALALHWLTERLIRWQTLWPEVEIRVRTGVSLPMWYSIDFDVAVTNTDHVPNSISAEFVCADQATLVIAPSRLQYMRLARGKVPGRPWFQTTPLIECPMNKNATEDWLTDNVLTDVAGKNRFEMPLLIQSVNELYAGRGAMIASRLLFQTGLKQKALFEPWPRLRSTQPGWWICTKKKNGARPDVTRVAEYLAREIRQSMRQETVPLPRIA